MESSLIERKCQDCQPGAEPHKLADAQVTELLKQIPSWKLADGKLKRTFKFKDFDQTMAFVNATAWVSRRENHHPDMLVGYDKLTMCYITHSAGGLTENDFICAAKVDALLLD